MFTFLTILLSTLILVLASNKPTAIVNTTIGPVQGLIKSTVVKSVEYAAFTGIRYGKPPIGYLRFKPPLPVDPWTETLNATSPGNECPQTDSITNSYGGSEDCLFLSVYTTVTNLTQTPSNLKTVMVWIYGGAFVSGSQSDPRHHPDYLLEKDIVLVTINYRIGALGFLCLNHRNATGNAGLKDQVLALKWVQANIRKFGGNPKNVTIFGESAGAVSVGLHVLSESSSGLFQGAISQSGTPLVPWGFTLPAAAESRARRLAGMIGESSSDKDLILEAFYAASPEDLVKYAPRINPATPFTPTIEDESIATDVFLSTCPIIKYNSGNFSKVPQLLGFMDQETVAFLSYLDVFDNIIDQVLDLTPSLVLTIIKDAIGSAFNLAEDIAWDLVELAVNETTDLAFKAQIDTTERLIAAHNKDKPVFYYRITFTTNTSLHNIDDNTTVVGAGHADDLAYIFYVPYANYSHNLSDPTALTIHRVTTMWTNFAKYGNPTPHWVTENPLGITWPPAGCDGKALNIGYDLKVESRPIDTNIEIIESASYFLLTSSSVCQPSLKPPTCSDNPGSPFSFRFPLFVNAPF